MGIRHCFFSKAAIETAFGHRISFFKAKGRIPDCDCRADSDMRK
jgi:hypothetical protein